MNQRFGGLTSSNMVALKDVAETGGSGAVGPPGPAGADGADGPAGPAGADGAQGIPGNDGADGIQGEPGKVDLMVLADYGVDQTILDKLKESTLRTYLESNPDNADVYWMMAGVIEYLGILSKGK